jgi:hypothetical protein
MCWDRLPPEQLQPALSRVAESTELASRPQRLWRVLGQLGRAQHLLPDRLRGRAMLLHRCSLADPGVPALHRQRGLGVDRCALRHHEPGRLLPRLRCLWLLQTGLARHPHDYADCGSDQYAVRRLSRLRPDRGPDPAMRSAAADSAFALSDSDRWLARYSVLLDQSLGLARPSCGRVHVHAPGPEQAGRLHELLVLRRVGL